MEPNKLNPLPQKKMCYVMRKILDPFLNQLFVVLKIQTKILNVENTVGYDPFLNQPFEVLKIQTKILDVENTVGYGLQFFLKNPN
jgi:hypothetical protein